MQIDVYEFEIFFVSSFILFVVFFLLVVERRVE